MEKISAEAKKRYAEKIKEYKKSIEETINKNRKLEIDIQKAKSTRSELSEADESGNLNFKELELADEYLNLVSYYILMNALSLSLLGIKNEGYLNDARKCCYKSIICLEEIVSSYIDSPFSDYEDGLESIKGFDDKKKFNFIKKFGFSIDSVVEGFGEGSKWKWSFVELEGRFAVITKNLINMKTIVSQLDPRIEGYSDRFEHLNLAKKLLQQASDRYREKYELSTLRLDDIKKAIIFLGALRRLHVLIGEAEQAEIVKKKMEIWKVKMETDQKKQEDARKMEKLKKMRK